MYDGLIEFPKDSGICGCPDGSYMITWYRFCINDCGIINLIETSPGSRVCGCAEGIYSTISYECVNDCFYGVISIEGDIC